jgi:hypothetical protein
MNIYKSKYLTINYFNDKKLLEYVWNKTTLKITNEQYLIEANKIITLGLKTDAKYVIADNREFFFPISPEIQDVVVNKLLGQVKGIIVKFAHIVSSDFISQLSLEQLYDEDIEKDYHSKFFDDYNEAVKWISEK